jgi:hypothetical protein
MFWRSQVPMTRWTRVAVGPRGRPGKAGELRSSLAAGSVTTCTFTLWLGCFRETSAGCYGPVVRGERSIESEPTRLLRR